MFGYLQNAIHSINTSDFCPKNNKVSPLERTTSPIKRATMPKNKIAQVLFDNQKIPNSKIESHMK